MEKVNELGLWSWGSYFTFNFAFHFSIVSDMLVFSTVQTFYILF